VGYIDWQPVPQRWKVCRANMSRNYRRSFRTLATPWTSIFRQERSRTPQWVSARKYGRIAPALSSPLHALPTRSKCCFPGRPWQRGFIALETLQRTPSYIPRAAGTAVYVIFYWFPLVFCHMYYLYNPVGHQVRDFCDPMQPT